MAGAGKPPHVAPRPTGRRLILFDRGVSCEAAERLLARVVEGPIISEANAASLPGMIQIAGATDATVLLRRLPVAAVGGGFDRAAAIAARLREFDEVIDTRPEFHMFAIQGPPWQDDATRTWGVEAVGAAASGFDGGGVKLAVLDTGLDFSHPDFAGRAVCAASFVPREAADDGQGHGTHCAGTICGGVAGGNVPRYGVAPGVALNVGKVLNNRGAGRELDILAGIEWAIEQGCAIVSMSLGRAVAPGEEPDPIYEEVAQRALEAGTLIVAATGNESDRRFGYVAPVGSPANCPSVLAVAAIGADAKVASFSSGGSDPSGGVVDVSAPGVGVFSSYLMPEAYKRLSGTSMACPHVAAIAALWAGSDPDLRGRGLWDKLIATARALPDSVADIGQGLVQAP